MSKKSIMEAYERAGQRSGKQPHHSERVKIGGKLYTLKDGKLEPIEPRKNVSQRLRERNSKRQKPVSRSKAANFNLIGKG